MVQFSSRTYCYLRNVYDLIENLIMIKLRNPSTHTQLLMPCGVRSPGFDNDCAWVARWKVAKEIEVLLVLNIPNYQIYLHR